jgi:hypothetical protein
MILIGPMSALVRQRGIRRSGVDNSLTILLINNATYIIIALIIGHVIMRIFEYGSEYEKMQLIIDRYKENLKEKKR